MESAFGDKAKHKTALVLFGRQNLKESPEERARFVDIFKWSSDPAIRNVAIAASRPEGDLQMKSIALLLEEAGLAIEVVASEYQKISRAHGLLQMSPYMPEMMEQTARAGVEKDEPCPVCLGKAKKTIIKKGKEIKRPCTACAGKGTRTSYDKDARRLAFETYGLIGGDRGNVNVNLDLRKVSQHESMADLSATVAPILEGSGRMRNE